MEYYSAIKNNTFAPWEALLLVFIEALFTTAKIQKKLKCPLTHESMKKMEDT